RNKKQSLWSEMGQIRLYDDIPAMSGLTTSGHPHATAEGLKSANNRLMHRSEQSDELAYSITLSASDRNDSGIISPSALAVFRLTTSSNLVGCSTGRSEGFAPRRILSTKAAARRKISGRLAA